PDLGEELVNHISVWDGLEHLPPGMHVAALGEGDQVLRQRTEGLRLRLRGLDSATVEQLGRQCGKDQPLMVRPGPQSRSLLRPRHPVLPYSGRSSRPSSSSLALTSSMDFCPKFRMSRSSASLFWMRSPTVLIPSRFKQL